MSGGSRSSYEGTYRSSDDRARWRHEEEEARRRREDLDEQARRETNARLKVDREREAAAAAESERIARENRERIESDRKRRLDESDKKARTEEARRHAKAAERSSERIDYHSARNQITAPPATADRVFVIAVDNSGSNRRIAEAIRDAAGHLHAAIGTMAPTATFAFLFFSDHTDGPKLFQYADYTSPDTHGEHVLRASAACIQEANGFDEAEAIECALKQVTTFNFGNVGRQNRHLILVTDVVAHGMGMDDDNGCPHQVSWRQSLRDVEQTFGSFRVVATGDSRNVLELQAKFVPSDRRQYDLLDMVTGGLNREERARLVPNAVLFQVFRTMGNQAVESFLGGLYEKWLANPMYGSDTKSRAKAQIRAFASYLELDDIGHTQFLEHVFGE